jgi:hypothetical protein
MKEYSRGDYLIDALKGEADTVSFKDGQLCKRRMSYEEKKAAVDMRRRFKKQVEDRLYKKICPPEG